MTTLHVCLTLCVLNEGMSGPGLWQRAGAGRGSSAWDCGGRRGTCRLRGQQVGRGPGGGRGLHALLRLRQGAGEGARGVELGRGVEEGALVVLGRCRPDGLLLIVLQAPNIFSYHITASPIHPSGSSC